MRVLAYLSKIIVISCVFFTMFNNDLIAQSTRNLYPIEVKKGVFSTKYLYDGRRLGSPYGLEIPLMQVDDFQVTKDFEVFKRSRNIVKILGVISSGFSLYSFFNRDEIPARTYWAALGTVGAVSAFFNIRSGVYFDRAVGRYNKIVSGTEIGLHYDKTHFGSGITSVGISYRF